VQPAIRQQSEAIGRDSATLAVSIHVWGDDIGIAGPQRVDRLAAYRELGMSRAIGLVRATATDDEALPRLVEDARAAGLTLD
jgi:hypothetical protein